MKGLYPLSSEFRDIFASSKTLLLKCAPHAAETYRKVFFQDGVCVDCIKADQKCQRDGQCCKGLVCDKYSWHNVDGECRAKRKAGP